MLLFHFFITGSLHKGCQGTKWDSGTTAQKYPWQNYLPAFLSFTAPGGSGSGTKFCTFSRSFAARGGFGDLM